MGIQSRRARVIQAIGWLLVAAAAIQFGRYALTTDFMALYRTLEFLVFAMVVAVVWYVLTPQNGEAAG
jgi:hypothetical protein